MIEYFVFKIGLPTNWHIFSIFRWEEMEKAVLLPHKTKKIPVESSMIVFVSLSIIYTA